MDGWMEGSLSLMPAVTWSVSTSRLGASAHVSPRRTARPPTNNNTLGMSWAEENGLPRASNHGLHADGGCADPR